MLLQQRAQQNAVGFGIGSPDWLHAEVKVLPIRWLSARIENTLPLTTNPLQPITGSSAAALPPTDLTAVTALASNLNLPTQLPLYTADAAPECASSSLFMQHNRRERRHRCSTVAWRRGAARNNLAFVKNGSKSPATVPLLLL